MAKVIEVLDINIAYDISINKAEVPENVYESLQHIKDKGMCNMFEPNDDPNIEAGIEWIRDNVNMFDAYDVKCKIRYYR